MMIYVPQSADLIYTYDVFPQSISVYDNHIYSELSCMFALPSSRGSPGKLPDIRINNHKLILALYLQKSCVPLDMGIFYLISHREWPLSRPSQFWSPLAITKADDISRFYDNDLQFFLTFIGTISPREKCIPNQLILWTFISWCHSVLVPGIMVSNALEVSTNPHISCHGYNLASVYLAFMPNTPVNGLDERQKSRVILGYDFNCHI